MKEMCVREGNTSTELRECVCQNAYSVEYALVSPCEHRPGSSGYVNDRVTTGTEERGRTATSKCVRERERVRA